GGFVPKFFNAPGNFLLQQFLVEGREHAHSAIGGDGDIAGIVGTAVGEGDGTGARDGKGAAAIGAGAGDDMVGNFFEVSVGGGEPDFGVALIVIEEVDAGVVGGPFG